MDITKKVQNFGINIAPSLEKPNISLLMILLVFIGIFTFKDYLFLNKLYIFLDIGSDSYTQAYPQFVNISDYIRNEGIPAWSFFHGMGQNIFPGEISNPFNLILYLLGREYLPYGIAYVEFLKILLGGIIFYYYLKLLPLSHYTCVIGSILFAYSGYMILGSGWYGHSAFIVFGAFFLFSFEKLFNENIWYYFPLSVVLVVSRSPFYLYILSVFLLLYSIFRILYAGGWSIKKSCLLYIKLAGLGFLGLAMVAPFVANDLLRIMESPRVGGDAGYFNQLMNASIFSFGSFSHNITAVLRLFSNDLLGAGSDFSGWYNYLEAPNFYCGLITLLLFPQIFYFTDKRRKIIFSFIIIWVFVVIFPFFRHALYLFTGDYYKGGLSFILPFTLLFYSLQALDSVFKKETINRKLLLSTLILLLGVLYFPYTLLDKKLLIVKEIRLFVSVFLILYTFILYFWGRHIIKIKTFRICILSLICIEAYMFSYITTNSRVVLTAKDLQQNVGYNDESLHVVEAIKEKDVGFYRIEKDYLSGIAIHGSLNNSLIQNYYGTSSYQQWNQKYYIRFLAETGVIDSNNEAMTRWAPGLSDRPLLQTISSVKYFISKKEVPDFYKITYKKLYRFGEILALENKYFLPLGFTYNRHITRSDFMKLNNLQKEMVLFKAFVTENDAESLQGFERFDVNKLKDIYTYKEYEDDVKKLSQDTMNIITHNQNNIKGNIQVKGSKLLFFSIPYDKGWHIFIDGKKQKSWLVNIGFMGVIIPDGVHEIELTFTPPFLISGYLVMFFSFVLYVLLIFKGRLSFGDNKHVNG